MKRYIIEKWENQRQTTLFQSDSIEEIIKEWQSMPQWEERDSENCISIEWSEERNMLIVDTSNSDYNDVLYRLLTPEDGYEESFVEYYKMLDNQK